MANLYDCEIYQMEFVNFLICANRCMYSKSIKVMIGCKGDIALYSPCLRPP